jgi:hypothetical protein
MNPFERIVLTVKSVASGFDGQHGSRCGRALPSPPLQMRCHLGELRKDRYVDGAAVRAL